MLREERKNLRHESLAYTVAVIAVVDLQGVGDVQPRERLIELSIRGHEWILVPDVQRDRAHRFERRDVLIDHDQRRVGEPLFGNEWLEVSVLRRPGGVETRRA